MPCDLTSLRDLRRLADFQCVQLSSPCKEDFQGSACQLKATSLDLTAVKVNKRSIRGFMKKMQANQGAVREAEDPSHLRCRRGKGKQTSTHITGAGGCGVASQVGGAADTGVSQVCLLPSPCLWEVRFGHQDPRELTTEVPSESRTKCQRSWGPDQQTCPNLRSPVASPCLSL